MKIAILGATSQIARDLIGSFSARTNYNLHLFARRPEVVKQWLVSVKLSGRYAVDNFATFSSEDCFDAIINFVGAGDPAQVVAMGASIYDVTFKYDQLALDYLRSHPDCRYLFLSSGSAYGSNFDQPADGGTKAVVAINNLQPQDWYGVAKLYAECRHRLMTQFSIIDIRVFSYFSHSQNIDARYFISDVLRAIRDKGILQTSSATMVRDYLGPEDFFRLVTCLLAAPRANDVVDCYTIAPVAKAELLEALSNQFCFRYQYVLAPVGINATGHKAKYYSTNCRAADYGYLPSMTSLETVVRQTLKVLDVS